MWMSVIYPFIVSGGYCNCNVTVMLSLVEWGKDDSSELQYLVFNSGSQYIWLSGGMKVYLYTLQEITLAFYYPPRWQRFRLTYWSTRCMSAPLSTSWDALSGTFLRHLSVCLPHLSVCLPHLSVCLPHLSVCLPRLSARRRVVTLILFAAQEAS